MAIVLRSERPPKRARITIWRNPSHTLSSPEEPVLFACVLALLDDLGGKNSCLFKLSASLPPHCLPQLINRFRFNPQSPSSPTTLTTAISPSPLSILNLSYQRRLVLQDWRSARWWSTCPASRWRTSMAQRTTGACALPGVTLGPPRAAKRPSALPVSSRSSSSSEQAAHFYYLFTCDNTCIQCSVCSIWRFLKRKKAWIGLTLPRPLELASELQRMATLMSYHLAKSNSVCSPATHWQLLVTSAGESSYVRWMEDRV